MKEMVKQVVDAGSYAPVTILIEERADSVRISYDRMTSSRIVPAICKKLKLKAYAPTLFRAMPWRLLRRL